MAATLKQLGATQAAISAWTPPSSSGSGGRVASDGSVSFFDPDRVGVMTAGGNTPNVTVNQVVNATNTSTSEITNATIAAVRYGMVAV